MQTARIYARRWATPASRRWATSFPVSEMPISERVDASRIPLSQVKLHWDKMSPVEKELARAEIAEKSARDWKLLSADAKRAGAYYRRIF